MTDFRYPSPAVGIAPSVGATFPVTPDGTSLTLSCPPVADARLAITSASLIVEASATLKTCSDITADLKVLTDRGPCDKSGLKGLVDDKKILTNKGWVVVEWGTPRVVQQIKLDTTPEASPLLGRLKITDGVLWYPLPQKEYISLGKSETLPYALATGLMIEIVEGVQGVYKPAFAPLSALEVKFVESPRDLTVAVVGGPILLELTGQMLPGAEATVQAGLADAMNARLPRDGRASTIPLILRSRIAGVVTLKAFTCKAERILSELDDGATLLLPWFQTTRGRLLIGEGVQLSKLALRVTPTLLRERVDLKSDIDDLKVPAGRLLQLADPQHAVAQHIPTPDAPLVGIDLFITHKSPVRAQVSICADAQGTPDERPITKDAVFPVSLDTPSPGRWLSLTLPKPLRLQTDLWIVVRVDDGELQLPIVDARDSRLRLIHRTDGSSWSTRHVRTLDYPALGFFTRVDDDPPFTTFDISVQRGNASISISPDGQSAAADALALLNKSTDPVLHFTFRANPDPKRAVAGTLEIHDLHVQCF